MHEVMGQLHRHVTLSNSQRLAIAEQRISRAGDMRITGVARKQTVDPVISGKPDHRLIGQLRHQGMGRMQEQSHMLTGIGFAEHFDHQFFVWKDVRAEVKLVEQILCCSAFAVFHLFPCTAFQKHNNHLQIASFHSAV